MFFLDKQLNQIKEKNNNDMPKFKERLRDCWNSFQWVTNRLDEWASETVIGANLRENLVNLNKALELLIANTDNLTDQINGYCARQDVLNSGKLN